MVKKKNHEIFQKVAAAVYISIICAAITAAILAIVSHLRTVPTYTIPWINLTLSRWWDILFVFIYVFVSGVIHKLEVESQVDEVTQHILFEMVVLIIMATGITAVARHFYGFKVGFLVGLTFILISGLVSRSWKGLVFRCCFGFVAGVMFGMGNGLLFGFISLLISGLQAIFGFFVHED